MQYAQIAWSSFADAGHQVLLAVAFAFTLKVTKVWNFSQGGLLVASFYAMLVAKEAGLSTAGIVAAGLVCGLAFNAVVELVGFRALRRRASSGMTYFIFSLVVAQLVAYVLTLWFGTGGQRLDDKLISPSAEVLGVVVTRREVTAVVVAVVLLTALAAYLRHTKAGRAQLAVANNAWLAELYGLSAQAAYLRTMLIAAVLVTSGVFLMGSTISVTPDTGSALILLPVAATVVGGVGNIWGAAGAAVGLSLLNGFSALIFPSIWQGFILYIFLFLLILLVPHGVPAAVRQARLSLAGGAAR